MPRLFIVGLTAALATAVLIAVLAIGAAGQAPAAVPAFTKTYDHRVLDDGLEILLVQSDGQAFATLARDPSLARPLDFGSRVEASYRAQRMLLPYLAWAGSAGRPGWVPPALAGLFVLAVGGAAMGLGLLLERRGCSPWPAVGLLALPGTYAALEYFGPEVLALALVVWGIAAWTGGPTRRGRAVAVALFCLAALARETSLLVPLVLAFAALRRRRVGDAVALTLPFAALCAWYVVLRVRIGAWPFDRTDGRLGLPGAGLAKALGEGRPSEILPFALIALVVMLATVVLCRRDILTSVVVAHAAFSLVLGDAVWVDWHYYGRVLLPLYALGFVALLSHVLGPEPLSPSS